MDLHGAVKNIIFGAKEMNAARMQSSFASSSQTTARSVIMHDAASVMGNDADKMLSTLMDQAASTDKKDAAKTLLAKAVLMPLDRLAGLYEKGEIAEKEYANELKKAVGSTQKTLANLQLGNISNIRASLSDLADTNILTADQRKNADIDTLAAFSLTNTAKDDIIRKTFNTLQANMGMFKADERFANSYYSTDYSKMANMSKLDDPNIVAQYYQNTDKLFNRESVNQLIGSTTKFEDIKAKKLDELIKATNSSNEELIKAVQKGTAATESLANSLQYSQNNSVALGGLSL